MMHGNRVQQRHLIRPAFGQPDPFDLRQTVVNPFQPPFGQRDAGPRPLDCALGVGVGNQDHQIADLDLVADLDINAVGKPVDRCDVAFEGRCHTRKVDLGGVEPVPGLFADSQNDGQRQQQIKQNLPYTAQPPQAFPGFAGFGFLGGFLHRNQVDGRIEPGDDVLAAHHFAAQDRPVKEVDHLARPRRQF